ncbi:MAG: OsmC family protein [Saprospiraceae bacterium]|nr:OsmC family protein [Saprospiraceae bacterium]
MKRISKAVWKGTGKEGSGVLNSQSGALEDLPYSFKMRFENEDGTKGTNPEELIAAAHAGCFAMALAVQLQGAGYTADSIDVSATLKMIKDDKGWVADTMNLVLDAQVPDISQEKFDELAGNAKTGCPISRSLNCEIVLEATLSS